MEHSQLRLLATVLFPGLLVFLLLFTVRSPILHSPSYWRSSPPPLHDAEHPQLPKLTYGKIYKRSAASSSTLTNFIGLRNVEDPGACLKDPACRGYLAGKAKDNYDQCMARVRKYSHAKKAKNNGCHFINGKGRGVVALTSFPGSGNTWVRSLLEKSTGICTGSYTCDMSLRYAGFTGEGIQSANVVAVKTHQASPNWASDISSFKFSSAIFLVRNPLDALVSDWNRYVANGFQYRTVQLGTHTHKAGREYFRNNTGWNGFVHRRANLWRDMIDNWIVKSKGAHKHRVLVIMYEDIQNNEEAEVKRMLKFLHMDQLLNETAIVENTEATNTRPLQNFTTSFHRQHTSSDEAFEPYTATQKTYVHNTIRETQKKLEKYHLTDMLDVRRYLEEKSD